MADGPGGVIRAEQLRPLGEAAPGRESLPIRILQVGAGNFLRGFADWMVHRANDAGSCGTASWS
ncbi:hypothetical protein Jiend_53280 [Micromonospora endophytica]|uniref:hypothetical protein n=1 Tax=Micromonospora endophytica TaxID=515350 RepID=UPI001BB3AB4F|nr:hypothetical protein [Micromonospora endophytica]BCJ61906.1 hypothetical protein Jiend_53280 [Micromonospora endophytica]